MYKSIQSFILLLVILFCFFTEYIQAQTLVENWGSTVRGNGWPILNDSSTVAGNAGMGADGPPLTWATIRGGFDTIEVSLGETFVVTGQFEYVGGGTGNSYVPLRYAITFLEDEGTLQYQYTDSATWSSWGRNYGYLLTPISSTADIPSGSGGFGTIWKVIGVSGWNSIWTSCGYPLGDVVQSPYNAEIVEGVYNFAISVQCLTDSTNEIRWNMFHEDEQSYYFSGIVIDTFMITTRFNGICFGIGDDITTNLTQFNLKEVQVGLGDPIEIVTICPTMNYIEDWGFIGDRTGGWHITLGDFAGNVTISGESPNTDWVAVRGEFNFTYGRIQEYSAWVISGSMEFEVGGFENPNSLRIGVFNTDSAGTLIDTIEDSAYWSGSEAHHDGYLLIPPSGTSEPMEWEHSDQLGTFGAVLDGIWLNPTSENNYLIANTRQYPVNAVAGAGTYDFEIAIGPSVDGITEIRFYITNDDHSYNFGGIYYDQHEPNVTDRINCINFAFNTNASTTALKLKDVQVFRTDSISIPDSILTGIVNKHDKFPAQYELNQNYPNPFNSVTFISFSLPSKVFVSLKVYDVLGREVATIVSEELSAGNYTKKWNAVNFASGIYYYRLQAGSFSETRKLVLLR